MRLRTTALLGFALAGALHGTAPLAAQDLRVIRAGSFINADGQLQAEALLILERGNIKQVGGTAPAGATVDEYPGAVVAPGLIDIHAQLGAVDNLAERQAALQPAATAADAFDRYHAHLAAALRAGVTTFVLAPDDSNIVGGTAVICQTAGPEGKPALLNARGPLKLSLSPTAFQTRREPTSRSGALGMLRDALAAARKSSGVDGLAVLRGSPVPALITAPSAADVLALLELSKEFEFKFVPLHTADARALAGELRGAVPGVVVGPLNFTSPPRLTTAAGVLEEAGVPVAIQGGLPQQAADSLRTAAAIAARDGLSLPAARRAISTVPAALLGLGERLGRIDAGLQADLVVFSGDPLDLRSHVLAVYVGGRRVWMSHH